MAEENTSFNGVERRRNAAIAHVKADPRGFSEVAIFHELGKALTSSLQLDQVLRTIMQKVDEFLHTIADALAAVRPVTA